MNKIVISEISQSEIYFLKEMLFEAIFVPEGLSNPEREIIEIPEINIYIKDFGRKDDFCLVAKIEKELIGAIWIRQFTKENKGFGFVNTETPELSMAIKPEFQGQGIGTKMLDAMFLKLTILNYKQVSLSVDKRNFAYDLYKKFDFKEVEINENSIKMLKVFLPQTSNF